MFSTAALILFGCFQWSSGHCFAHHVLGVQGRKGWKWICLRMMGGVDEVSKTNWTNPTSNDLVAINPGFSTLTNQARLLLSRTTQVLTLCSAFQEGALHKLSMASWTVTLACFSGRVGVASRVGFASRFLLLETWSYHKNLAALFWV